MDSPDLYNSSPAAFQKERKDSWSKTLAIVYDSVAGRLYRMPEDEVTDYRKAIMPGKSTKADIYLEVDKTPETDSSMNEHRGNAQAWLARVDLGRLGWTARWKRHMGEINYVYVKKGEQGGRSIRVK